MQPLLTSFVALVAAASLAVPLTAHAEGIASDTRGTPVKTVQQVVADLASASTMHSGEKALFASVKAQVIVASAEGVKTLDVKEAELNLWQFLETNGVIAHDYRTSQGGRVPKSLTVEPNTTYFIFKVEKNTTFKQVELKAPLEEVESNSLAVGSEIVIAEGTPGSAVKTVVALNDLSRAVGHNQGTHAKSSKTRTETISIVTAPTPRKVIRGVNETPDAPVGNGLIFPLENYTPTSAFGMRTHPITGVYKLHDGADFGAPCGAPVVASSGGQVISVETKGGYGDQIAIDHGAGVETLYNHLSKFSVAVGDVVAQGQEVGEVGTTGWSTGCHLHFMVTVDGEAIDPMTVLEGKDAQS